MYVCCPTHASQIKTIEDLNWADMPLKDRITIFLPWKREDALLPGALQWLMWSDPYWFEKRLMEIEGLQWNGGGCYLPKEDEGSWVDKWMPKGIRYHAKFFPYPENLNEKVASILTKTAEDWLEELKFQKVNFLELLKSELDTICATNKSRQLDAA